MGLNIHRALLVAVHRLAVYAGECGIAHTLAVHIIAMVRASELLTALASKTCIALADAMNAVAPGTAIVYAFRLLAVNAREPGVANTLAFNVATMAGTLE